MATAREFQPIPVIADACPNCGSEAYRGVIAHFLGCTGVSTEVDTSAALIALLDATLDHHRALVALAAAVPGARRYYGALLELDPTEDNERVLRLWTSAHNFALRDTTYQYDPSPAMPHGYTIRAIRVYAGERHDPELIYMSFGIVAKPEPITDVAAAIRDALREPHWTEDKVQP